LFTARRHIKQSGHKKSPAKISQGFSKFTDILNEFITPSQRELAIHLSQPSKDSFRIEKQLEY
jgi:hypothetical protein